MNKKEVKFSNTINIKEIPPRSAESPGMMRYLHSSNILLCDEANYGIMNILNGLSKHKIVITNQEELPFIIYSKDKPWYNDKTPIFILNNLKRSKKLLYGFVYEYNSIIEKYIDVGKSSFLEYQTRFGDYFIKINALIRN